MTRKLWNLSLSKVRISDNLEKITAWNYFKIEQTGDLSYLNIDYDEYGKNIKLEGEKYQRIWNKLKREYLELTSTGETEEHLKRHSDVVKISIKIEIVKTLGELYQMSVDKTKVIEMLKEWGVEMTDNYFTSIENIKKYLEVNIIMLKRAQEKVKVDDEDKSPKSDIYKVRLYLEKSLEKNDIDFKKINMLYFAEMLNMARKINENYAKQLR